MLDVQSPWRTVLLGDKRIGLRVVGDLFGGGIPIDFAAGPSGNVQQMTRVARAVTNLDVRKWLRMIANVVKEDLLVVRARASKTLFFALALFRCDRVTASIKDH